MHGGSSPPTGIRSSRRSGVGGSADTIGGNHRSWAVATSRLLPVFHAGPAPPAPLGFRRGFSCEGSRGDPRSCRYIGTTRAPGICHRTVITLSLAALCSPRRVLPLCLRSMSLYRQERQGAFYRVPRRISQMAYRFPANTQEEVIFGTSGDPKCRSHFRCSIL